MIVAIVGIAAHKIKQEQEAKEARALVSSLLKEDNSKDDDNDDYDDDVDDNDDDSDSDETYHKVGKSAKVGGVTYTLKSVEVTDERNEFEDKQPKYVIKVVYHIKNETGDELPIGSDLDMYDPDNNKLEEYAIDGTTLDTVADGKEADVAVGFSADKLGSFELQFCPFGDDAEPVKFTAEVQ